MEKNLSSDLKKLVDELYKLLDKRAIQLQSESGTNIYREDYFKKRKLDIDNFKDGIEKLVIPEHGDKPHMYDTVYAQCKKDADVIAKAINAIP